jgi:hypothetical protein
MLMRDTYTNPRQAADRLQIEDGQHLVQGALLVRASRYPDYEHGNELEVDGSLGTPLKLEEFSYCDCLARQAIYGVPGWPKTRLLGRGGGSPSYRFHSAFKARTGTMIARILPEPEGSLLTAILLGVQSGVPLGGRALSPPPARPTRWRCLGSSDGKLYWVRNWVWDDSST